MARAPTIAIDTVSGFLLRVDAALQARTLDTALAGISDAVGVLVARVKVYFGVYRRDAPPIVLGLDAGDEWNRSYSSGHYLLDPTYEAFLRLEHSVCLLPQEAFPRGFRTSEFYLSYYRPMGMVDEICFLLRLDRERAAYVSVMRLDEAPPFASADGARLRMALPAVESMMRHAWALHERSGRPADADARALHLHLAGALEQFGRGLLSEREAEVTRLLLKGLVPKIVGRMLEIAPGTVRNHIKSIYTKLGVRSQAELLAAFFDALASRASPPQ